MPKKKPEMSQVYRQNSNEFIFSERGGRGKNLSSFLKNLSLTGSSSRKGPEKDSSDDIRQINSKIYGNMSYGYESPDQGGRSVANFPSQNLSQAVLSTSSVDLRSGLGNSSDKHIGSISPSQSLGRKALSRTVSSSGDSRKSGYRRSKYADLDDDWDADFSDMREDTNGGSRETFESVGNSESFVNSAISFPSSHRASLSGLDSLHPNLVISAPSLSEGDNNPDGGRKDPEKSHRDQNRLSKFIKVLTDDEVTVNVQELRKLSWNGIPANIRALTWQLLLGYLPTNKARQQAILKRKRQEYSEGISKYGEQFEEKGSGNASQAPDSSNKENSANKEKQLHHQITIDVKRTNQTLKLYSYPATQKSLRKILFLWAIRHPASGYVQGINDICTPFYQLFLNNYLWQLQKKRAHELNGTKDESRLFIPGLLDESGSDSHENAIYEDPSLPTLTWHNFDPARLSSRVTSIIEADSYWCISRLLDNITDNYIHEQPGIIKQVNDLQSLMTKIDASLVQHLESEGVEFLQFSFRWMNCLLMRELSIDLVIRMWDTYLSETPLGFNGFHIYVCAAFLIKFSNDIKERDFQDILLLLQNPPTTTWSEKDIGLMLSEAFVWKSLYENAGARSR